MHLTSVSAAPISLPIYQHPTLAVLVDDSPGFLHSLRFQLGPDFPCKTFSDPHAALDWLRARAHADGALRDCFSPGADSYTLAPQALNIALHVDQICRIRCEPQRFMTPSVLVVDYSMPGMDGVRLCEALADLPCKKILLTGVADERVAIDAFNRGLIDRYIRKGDGAALERLDLELAALQRAWFVDQSNALRALLPLHDYGFVTDPAVAGLVQDVRHCYQIVEHYLYKAPPGFLMYDREARPHLLAIETAASMRAHYEMACDSGAPAALREALARCAVIPNFSAGDGMYSSAFGRDWYDYTAPAQVCEGRETYYWALFDLAPDVLREPVRGFSEFLRHHADAG